MLDNIQNLRWRDFQKIDVTPFPFRQRLGAEEQKLHLLHIYLRPIVACPEDIKACILFTSKSLSMK